MSEQHSKWTAIVRDGRVIRAINLHGARDEFEARRLARDRNLQPLQLEWALDGMARTGVIDMRGVA